MGAAFDLNRPRTWRIMRAASTPRPLRTLGKFLVISWEGFGTRGV
jgi:hypothetical protein